MVCLYLKTTEEPSALIPLKAENDVHFLPTEVTAIIIEKYFLKFQNLCLQEFISEVGCSSPSFLAHLCALCARPPHSFGEDAELENVSATALLLELVFRNKSSLGSPLIKKQ